MKDCSDKIDVLFVAPLPPDRCGIAIYAAEHIERLREEGRAATTLGTGLQRGNLGCLEVDTFFRALGTYFRLRRLHAREVMIHYADDMFFPLRMPRAGSRVLCRLMQMLLLRLLAKSAGKSVLFFHEIPTAANLPKTNTLARLLAFQAFDHLVFFSSTVRQSFHRRFPSLPMAKSETTVLGQHMRRRFSGNQAEARGELGLPQTGRLYLCIGFVQHSKGFDDAVRAFLSSGWDGGNNSLHIVGEGAGEDIYVQELAVACAGGCGVFFHRGFVDDRRFDVWLAAADIVLLPYRGVASSAVGARAGLYGKELWIRNMPNLVEQFPHARVFSDAVELGRMMGLQGNMDISGRKGRNP